MTLKIKINFLHNYVVVSLCFVAFWFKMQRFLSEIFLQVKEFTYKHVKFPFSEVQTHLKYQLYT